MAAVPDITLRLAIVSLPRLERIDAFVRERANQNHSMHASWNEGTQDFASCTRGDCTEAREILAELDAILNSQEEQEATIYVPGA